MAASIPSTYEGHLEYKGPKERQYKAYYAVLLPKQLSLKESMTGPQLKAIYIKPGTKYGEGKTAEKKRIYEFYMDGITRDRHYFKAQSSSVRKSWLEYFKIAEEQDIGDYLHFQSPKQYGEYGQTQRPTPQHYGTLQQPTPAIYSKPPITKTMDGRRLPSIPDSDAPPSLPPGREDIPPALPPGRDDIPPPLPPGRPSESVMSPTDLRSALDSINEGSIGHVGKSRPPVTSGRSNPLEQRDSGIGASNDGTIVHGHRGRSPSTSGEGVCQHKIGDHAIRVANPHSAPSSGDGKFGSRGHKSRSLKSTSRDDAVPSSSSSDSTPTHSGGGTFTKRVSNDNNQYKWYMEGLSRDDAAIVLKTEKDKTLLYRASEKGHAISIKRPDKIYHHKVENKDGVFVFKGLGEVTGTTIYNIVNCYVEYCKGEVVPLGGSIDAKKEGHEEYDKPWNPPDVKIKASKIAEDLKRIQKKKEKTAVSPHLTKSSSSGKPIMPLPVVAAAIDIDQDYVNEGADEPDDGVYEINDQDDGEQLYLNMAKKEDIYQNTSDIPCGNDDELYQNLNQPSNTALPNKMPLATPRLPGGDLYINKAVEYLQGNDTYYLPIINNEDEGEVYEPVETQ